MSATKNAFQYSDFRVITSARFLFTLAIQIQAVAMGWKMYVLTKDPFKLGLIGLAEAVPAIGLALFAGLVVDRGRPLKIYKYVFLVNLLSVLLLLIPSKIYAIELLLLSSFISGLARGFSAPSLYSMIPKFVPREALHASSAWLTTAMQLAMVSGPALSGIFLATIGTESTFYVCILISLLAFSILFLIKNDPGKNTPSDHEDPILIKLSSGLRYVFKSPLLLSALSLDMFAVLFGGATALLPVFASEILKSGPESLGVLRASPAIGALIGSLLLIRRPITKNAGRYLLLSVTFFGIAMIGFSLSKDIMLSCFFLAMSGAVDAVSMVVRGAIVQLSSPDHLRGRIAAVNSIFIGSSNEIGAFESGLAARLLGTVPSVVFGGCMTIIVVAIVGFSSKSLRKLDLTQL